MGGAPRNLVPRSHFLLRIVKPSGRRRTDGVLDKQSFHGGLTNVVECRPPLGTFPEHKSGVGRAQLTAGFHTKTQNLVSSDMRADNTAKPNNSC